MQNEVCSTEELFACTDTLICLRLQAKAKILVVRDVERDDIEFISRTLGCLPIAHVDHMRPEKLGHAKLVEEESVTPSCCFLLMSRFCITADIRPSSQDQDRMLERSLQESIVKLQCCITDMGSNK